MAEQISAGGVVYKLDNNKHKIKLILTNKNRWGLPKGRVEPKEDIEVAALREVKEESGAEAKIQKPLGSAEWRLKNGDLKRVYIYLMELIKDGEVNDPDNEILKAEWKTIDEALKLVLFPPLRKMLIAGIKAIDHLKSDLCDNCFVRKELSHGLCLECLVAAKKELDKRNIKDYKKRTGNK